MNGEFALRIWELAAEPVRREGARARMGEPGALGCYEAALADVKVVYARLVNRITSRCRELAQIGQELAAITNEIGKLGGES